MGTTSDRLRAPRWARHPHVGACCLFVVVIFGVYWSVLDGTRSLLTNGPWSQPLFAVDPLGGGPIPAPLTRLATVAWLHLKLPIIDPFQGFGIPLLSDQGAPVYPPQVIAHLVFPGNLSIWPVVNVVALAFGVYLLARAFGQGFFGALAAGFLAALAGGVPPNVNTSVPNPLAILPFVLVAVRYAVDPASRHRRAAMLGIATSVALLCLSGFQELLPLMAAVIGVYTVALLVHYKPWRTKPLVIVGAGACVLAGAVVGSVGVLPTLSVVSSGTAVNGPTTYLYHFQTFWLSTLALPTMTGRSLIATTLDLHNSVSTVGTPLLVVVAVLALLIALRRGGERTRFYVLPSLAFVVYGVLAYADLGHVLTLMDIPLFDRIVSDRYVQFAWWIPLCLLLGAVITNARLLRWKDAMVAVVAAAGFDAYFYARYRQALSAAHVASEPSVNDALFVAAAVVGAFVALALAARWLGSGVAALLMAAVVLMSCLYDLPTNFAPARDGKTVTAVKVPGPSGPFGDELAFFGNRQLPAEQYSVQLWGPLVPTAYRATLSSLFSYSQTRGDGPFFPDAPSLGLLVLTPRALSVLRSLGVDELVVGSPLAGYTSPCDGAHPRTHGALCYLGEASSPSPTVGYAPARVYAYRVLGADPLVQTTATPVPVASTTLAAQELSRDLSTSLRAMPTRAYVTTSAAHLHGARGVHGVSRHASTQQVSITLRSQSAGLAVLRESYERAMHATVDGRRVAALPVDGGLWVAVDVPSGTSHVVLDYTTTADVAELGLGAAGLSLLGVLWLALAVVEVRQRRRRQSGPARSAT